MATTTTTTELAVAAAIQPTDDPWLAGLREKAREELARVYASAGEADRLREEVMRLRGENHDLRERAAEDRKTIHELRNRVGALEAEARLRAMTARAYPEPPEGR